MKRSLHIGINDYPGTQNDLSGCVNDANDWKEALKARGFNTTSLLNADAKKDAMIDAISKIVKETTKDDIAVITYSGHGTWIVDEDGDEEDGRDEALCPHDIMEGKLVTDDELYEIFSQRAWSARIIFISDSCHSGSVSKASNFMLGNKEEMLKTPKIRFLAPSVYLKNRPELLAKAKRVEFQIQARWKIRAATVLFAGCKDTEYSYDAWFNGRASGAFTYIALKVLKDMDDNSSYQDWFKKIRTYLPHERYPQTPQLSASYYQKSKWKVFAD